MGAIQSCAGRKRRQSRYRYATGQPTNTRAEGGKSLSKKKKLSQKLESSRNKLKSIKSQQESITKTLSSHDILLVDDKVRCAEKKFDELATRANKQLFASSTKDQSIQEFKNQVDGILAWLKEMSNHISCQDNNISYLVSDANKRVDDIKNLEIEMKKEEAPITQLCQNGKILLKKISAKSQVHKQLKKSISEIKTMYPNRLDSLVQMSNRWQQYLTQRISLNKDMEDTTRWLQNTEMDVQRLQTFSLNRLSVEGHKESVKKLKVEIENYDVALNAVLKNGNTICNQCYVESQAELQHKLSGLETRYNSLKDQITICLHDSETFVDQLCKYESNYEQLKKWYKTIKIKSSNPIHTDCATAVLRKQVEEYMALNKSCEESIVLLSDIETVSTSMITFLSATDNQLMKDQIKEITDKTTSVSKEVSNSLKILQDSLRKHDEIDSNLLSLSICLESIEKQTSFVTPIGVTVKEAEDLFEHYKELSAEMANHNDMVVRLREENERFTNTGLCASATNIQETLTKYSLLDKHITQLLNRINDGVVLRKQYYSEFNALEATFKDSCLRIDEILTLNVPTSEKVNRYKAICNELQSCDRDLGAMAEKANQIDLDLPEIKDNTLTSNLRIVQADINNTKRNVEQKIQECEIKEMTAKELNNSLKDTVSWLEQKYIFLSSPESFHLTEVKIDSIRQRYMQAAQESIDRIAVIREKVFSKEDASSLVDDNLKQQLALIEELEVKILDASKAKDKYLDEVKANQDQFEQSWKQVNDWVTGAEKLLDCGSVEDMDPDMLYQQLEEYREYLSEASLCQDEMDLLTETTEHMFESLDCNDKETLQQSLKSLNGRFANALSSLQNRQQTIEEKLDQWKEFQGYLQDFETILQDFQIQWSELETNQSFDDLNKISQFISQTDKFQKSFLINNDLVQKIKESGKLLDESKSSGCQLAIAEATTSVNKRWDTFINQIEAKYKMLLNINNLWQDADDNINKLEPVLHSMEDMLMPEHLNINIAASDIGLQTQCDAFNKIDHNLNIAEPTLKMLKDSISDLLQCLPTAEAKIHCQDKLLLFTERYERIYYQCQEYSSQILDEINERKNLNRELDKTLDWLQDCHFTIQRLGNMTDASTCPNEKVKKLIHEIDGRMKELMLLVKAQENKYQKCIVEMPTVLKLKINQVVTAHRELLENLKDKEEKLKMLQCQRKKYGDLMEDISQWLTDAELKIREKVSDVQQENARHKELMKEFRSQQKKLTNLRSIGGQIAKYSTDSVEKNKVQNTLTNLNKRHSVLQASISCRSQQLTEIEGLLRQFHETLSTVSCWYDSSEVLIKEPLVWFDFDKLRQHYKIYKRLSTELLENQSKVDHLNNTVKHLSQISDASEPAQSVSLISQSLFKIRGKINANFTSLDDAISQLDKFESQLKTLNEWLEITKQQLHISDSNLTIHDQLSLHDKILEDIENQKKKAEALLQLLPSQMQNANYKSAEHSALITKIEELCTSAQEHHCYLMKIVKEKEENDEEIENVKAALSSVQGKLSHTYSTSADIEILSREKQENEALAAQIRFNQARLNEINRRNNELSKKANFQKHSTFWNIPPPALNSSILEPQMSNFPSSNAEDSKLFDSGVFLSTSDLGSPNFRSFSISSPLNICTSSTSSPETSLSFGSIFSKRLDHSKAALNAPVKKISQDNFGSNSREYFAFNFDERTPEKFPTATKTLVSAAENSNSQNFRKYDMKRFGSEPKLMTFTNSLPSTPLNNSSLVPSSYSTPIIRAIEPHYNKFQWSRKQTIPGALMRYSPRPLSVQYQLETNYMEKKILPDPESEKSDKSNSKDVNLLTKREVQLSLSKEQEWYQSLIHDISSKLHLLNTKLCLQPPASHLNIDTHIIEHNAIEQDFNNLKDKIDQINNLSENVSQLIDPQGLQAVYTTLSVFNDRINILEAGIKDRELHLQEISTSKKIHIQELEAYLKTFREMERWISETKCHFGISVSQNEQDSSIEYLTAKLEENKNLQSKIQMKLQELSDMALQCDRVCKFEVNKSAEEMRSDLVRLQNMLAILKLNVLEQQNHLKQSLREAERKQNIPSNIEIEELTIDNWFVHSVPPENIAQQTENKVFVLEQQHQQQEKLQQDFSEHRKLVQYISSQTIQQPPVIVSSKLQGKAPPDGSSNENDWRRLHACSFVAKQQLLDRVQMKPLGLHFSSAQYMYSDGNAVGKKPNIQSPRIKQCLSDLNGCWKKIKQLPVEDQMSVTTMQQLEKKEQVALWTISHWLDTMEQYLFTVPPKNGIPQKLKDNETMQKSITSLKDKLNTSIVPVSQHLTKSLPACEQMLPDETLMFITDRMLLLTSQIQIHADHMKRCKKYEEMISKLRTELVTIQSEEYVTVSDKESPYDMIIDKMKNAEIQLKDLENGLNEFKTKEEESSAIPNWIFSEFTDLQLAYMDTKRKVMDRKASLLQSSSIQTQYEKLLEDFADFLVAAQNKLKKSSKLTTARDITHLQHQLKSHKDFFSDMEGHRALLDSLAEQCDQSMREKHSSQHQHLSTLTEKVKDEANLYGQRLDHLVKQWLAFNVRLGQLKEDITSIENSCAPLSTHKTDSDINISLQEIRDRKEKYKKIQLEISRVKPLVFQILDEGKALLMQINSSSLETSVTSIASTWAHLHSQITDSNSSLEDLYSQVEQYNASASLLCSWLDTAKIKLAALAQLSEEDNQNIGVIRNKMEKLLEFRKDVDCEVSNKNKLLSIVFTLQEHHPKILNSLNINVDTIKEQWETLQQDISSTEQVLHTAQMALMPSRQALQELALFLKKVSKAISNDAKKTINLSSKINPLLKKYQGFKIELENKQLTLDFVNQCVLKPSNEDSPSAHVEKVEFSEKLSDLNEQWTQVNEELLANLTMLSVLVEKWEEFESLHQDLSHWFVELNDRIKKHEIIGMEVNVKHSIKECQALHEKLVLKEADVEKLKLLGNELIQLKRVPSGSKNMVKEKIDGIFKEWQQMNIRLTQQEKYLNDIKAKWNEFSTEKNEVLHLLTELEYYLGSNSSLTIGDYHTLEMQISKLKSLSSEIQLKAPKQEHMMSVAGDLLQICEAPVKHDLQNTTSNIQNRWKTLTTELQDHAKFLELCLDMWKTYDAKYLCFCQEISQIERSWEDLAQSSADDTQLKTNLNKIEELQAALDVFQSKLPELYQLSDEMGPKLDTVSIVSMTSRQTALEQRLLLLRHSADKLSRQISENLHQYKGFEQMMGTISNFLQKASDTLQKRPSRSSNEDTASKESLIQFKELLVEFNINAPLLDNLNELGYRMILSDDSIQELQQLNHKWYQLKSETVELCHNLQDNILLQQDFTEKCSMWMSYLAQIENELAIDIEGNLDQLVGQQKKYQTLKSELVNKQQILHAIIADGQRMQKPGESGDTNFGQNLTLLSEQWHNVVKRINQKVNTVDGLISLWRNFNEQSTKFHNWLTDQEISMEVFGSDVTSMRRIRNDIQKLKNIQNEFKLQADRYDLLHKDGQKLLQYMDGSSADELKTNLRQLEQKLQILLKKLSEQMAKSQEATRQYDFCEKELEELLAWLKDIRKIITKPLLTSYVDLEAELHQCKDIQSSAASYDERYQLLLTNVSRLNQVLQLEDVSLLQQRMKLLDKQWVDISMETDVRILQIKECLDRWPQLYMDINNFCSWCEQMETRILSTSSDTIESVLEKLEKEYDNELSAKEAEKEDLVAVSQVLKKGSGQLRSADIETRVQQADQKWQHLQAVITNRKHKLRETMLAVQQLDINMDVLRKWLKQMEGELFSPLKFTQCNYEEIETKLKHHQVLQKEIESYSSSIASVHNLCEVLLHDTDACRTQLEYDTLNEAKNTLEKRWQKICELSPEKSARIEEVWKYWKTFLHDYNGFSNWMKTIENVLEEYNDSHLSENVCEYEEIETIQQEINEYHGQLENINKQYKMMVKEGFVDSKNDIKDKTWECNEGWDNLSKKVLCIMGDIRKTAVAWDEYHLLHDELMKWLKEVDVKLIQVEKAVNVTEKITCLSEIKHEQNMKNAKFQRFGDLTNQLLEMVEEVSIKTQLQQDIDKFQDYHDFIIGRRLHQLQIETENDKIDVSSHTIPYDQTYRESVLHVEETKINLGPSTQDCLDLKSDSLQLEDKFIQRPPDQVYSDQRISTEILLKTQNADPNSEMEAYLQEIKLALEDCTQKLDDGEEKLRYQTPVGPELDDRVFDYSEIMSDCQSSMDNVSKVYNKIIARQDLLSISTVEQEHISNVFDRWNRLKGCLMEKESKLKNNNRDWSQFNIDLKNIISWLENSEKWLDSVNIKSIKITEQNKICKKLKILQAKLMSKRAIVDSLNLTGSIYSKGSSLGSQTVEHDINTMNTKWEVVNEKSEKLRIHLNGVGSGSDSFIEEVKSVSTWISETKDRLRQCRTHTIDIDNDDIYERHSKLKILKSEIEQMHPYIINLKESSMHVSFDKKDPAKAKAKDDIHIASALAYALMNQITTSITIIESRADFDKKIHESSESRERTILSPFGRIRKFLFGRGPGSSTLSPPPSSNEQVYGSITDGTAAGTANETEELKKEIEDSQNQEATTIHPIATAISIAVGGSSSVDSNGINAGIEDVPVSNDAEANVKSPVPFVTKDSSATIPSSPVRTANISLSSESKTMGRPSPKATLRKKNSSGAKQTSHKTPKSKNRKNANIASHDVVDSSTVKPTPSPLLQEPKVLDAPEEHSESSRTCCASFCRRAFRAALPLQILLLLLLGFASLVPMTKDDYSCTSNYMERSLTFTLHYPNGPPPV